LIKNKEKEIREISQSIWISILKEKDEKGEMKPIQRKIIDNFFIIKLIISIIEYKESNLITILEFFYKNNHEIENLIKNIFPKEIFQKLNEKEFKNLKELFLLFFKDYDELKFNWSDKERIELITNLKIELKYQFQIDQNFFLLNFGDINKSNIEIKNESIERVENIEKYYETKINEMNDFKVGNYYIKYFIKNFDTIKFTEINEFLVFFQELFKNLIFKNNIDERFLIISLIKKLIYKNIDYFDEFDKFDYFIYFINNFSPDCYYLYEYILLSIKKLFGFDKNIKQFIKMNGVFSINSFLIKLHHYTPDQIELFLPIIINVFALIENIITIKRFKLIILNNIEYIIQTLVIKNKILNQQVMMLLFSIFDNLPNNTYFQDYFDNIFKLGIFHFLLRLEMNDIVCQFFIKFKLLNYLNDFLPKEFIQLLEFDQKTFISLFNQSSVYNNVDCVIDNNNFNVRFGKKDTNFVFF
jgi:hypothetical protein